MLRVNQSVGADVKNKLSNTLRNWLPILHTSLADMGEAMAPFVEANPVIEVKSGFEENFEKKIPKKVIYGDHVGNSSSTEIEALTIDETSIFEDLDEQINDKMLFPTPISQKVARYVIENLDENGYFEGDIELFCRSENISYEQFEKIRARFAFIEPVGIGSLDVKESFTFQLQSCEGIDDGVYTLVMQMIEKLDNLLAFKKEPLFNDALKCIHSFTNPPLLNYFKESEQIIPDLYIYVDDENNIDLKLNIEYYPEIKIESEYALEHDFIKAKIKEAQGLVDAIEMRKATLYKVGLMIIEYQYDFFMGGSIKPLTLKMLADEFGHNPSTISRAIANKYIACNRGTFAMKEFFSTALDEDTSNASIKEFLANLIKNEPREKPLSDMKLLALIQDEFKIKIVRRTLAKYRKQLNIAGSSERKKLYQLEVK